MRLPATVGAGAGGGAAGQLGPVPSRDVDRAAPLPRGILHPDLQQLQRAVGGDPSPHRRYVSSRRFHSVTNLLRPASIGCGRGRSERETPCVRMFWDRGAPGVTSVSPSRLSLQLCQLGMGTHSVSTPSFRRCKHGMRGALCHRGSGIMPHLSQTRNFYCFASIHNRVQRLMRPKLH